MSLVDDIPQVIKHVQNHMSTLDHNHVLFEIYEGDLLSYLLADLQKQLSPKAFDQIKQRVAPINLLHQVVDKLSQIYEKAPTREIIQGDSRDNELFDIYFGFMQPNFKMNIANEFFNLFKYTFVEPIISKGIPQLRLVPGDRALAMSLDKADPTRMTHWIKIMGEVDKQTAPSVYNPSTGSRTKTESAKRVIKLFVYTDEEFLIIDSDGDIMRDEMAVIQNDGENVFGKIPAIYINRSLHSIVPKVDSDMLKMTKLIPILMSDMNFAIMYQAFSIIFGIDLNSENLERNPNVFWNFKTDPKNENAKPQLGAIKPDVDIDQVLGWIQGLLVFWLQSRNIRPGTVGQLNGSNFANGISKIIDEMDTSSDRQKQVAYFTPAESDLWMLISRHMHPYWVANNLIEENRLFSGKEIVKVTFHEQRPMLRRKDVIDEQKAEVDARFTTRKRAIMRINPEMKAEEVEQLLSEIDAETTVSMEDRQPAPPDQDHTHEGTGQAFMDGENHYHLMSDGSGQTSSDPFGPNHTHTTPNGEKTSGPQG